MPGALRLAVCLSFADRRPDVDPLSGEVSTDVRTSRLSDADAAALDLALRRAEGTPGATVVAVTVGPPAAEVVLREALACGAAQAVRVDASPARAEGVAAALAAVLRDVDEVWCGDQGLEAGSGAVPALLAVLLGAAGAFGLVEVEASPASADRLVVVRRLDGGRRERLAVSGRAVLSVEGSVARLRRAGLPGVLRAERATIEVVRAAAAVAGPGVRVGLPAPYRPRPRVVPAPVGATALDRVRSLTGAGLAGAGAEGDRRSAVAATPDEAASAILDALARWGYELPERSAP